MQPVVVFVTGGRPHTIMLSPATPLRSLSSPPLRFCSPWMALQSGPWWIALGVLLLNDHMLKGSGVIPGALTGKLSDVAGLVVAPLLLVALVGVRRASTRVACFTAVAGVFVVINLSAVASDALVDTVAYLGVRWTMWPDPTDLVALAVLPLTWRLQFSPRRAARSEGRVLTFVHAAGIGVGAFACVATSIGEYTIMGPFLVNRSHAPVIVDVRRFVHAYPCGDKTLGLDRSLQVSDFEAAHDQWSDATDTELAPNISGDGTGDDTDPGATGTINGDSSDPRSSTSTSDDSSTEGLDPWISKPANGLFRPGDYGGLGPSLEGECGAAWVQVDGHPGLVAAWDAAAETTRTYTELEAPAPSLDDDEFYRHSLSIEGPSNALVIAAGRSVTILELAPPQG